jgi:hypothetical protein
MLLASTNYATACPEVMLLTCLFSGDVWLESGIGQSDDTRGLSQSLQENEAIIP